MNAIAAVLAGLTGCPIEARLALTRPSALHPILAAAVRGAAPPPHTRTRLTVAAEEARAAASLLQIGSQTGQMHLRQTDNQTELVRQTVKSVIHPDRQPDRQIVRWGSAAGLLCRMQDSDTPLAPAGRRLCSQWPSFSSLQPYARSHTSTSSPTAAHKQEVRPSHMLPTTYGVVCSRSIRKLTSSAVLLGQTCPCGRLQSKQLPWKEDRQTVRPLSHCS